MACPRAELITETASEKPRPWFPSTGGLEDREEKQTDFVGPIEKSHFPRDLRRINEHERLTPDEQFYIIKLCLFKICVFLLCTSGETLGNVDLGFRIWKSSGNRGDLKAKRAMLLFI